MGVPSFYICMGCLREKFCVITTKSQCQRIKHLILIVLQLIITAQMIARTKEHAMLLLLLKQVEQMKP